MKEPKQECAKPPKPPTVNMKNKVFVKWSRAETCRKDDNIVTTDWHETLKTTKPFEPAYDNMPLNMVYLLSGEYGRIWQKERDEWYSNVFVPKARERDMMARRKKLRQQIKEAKKAAEISIKERKERRVKELEAKAKAEVEKLEKIKAKVRKLAAGKPYGKVVKKKDTKSKTSSSEQDQKQETCPKGWTPVELTLQCECSDHKKEKSDLEKKEEGKPEISGKPQTENLTSDESCVMCEGYVQQLKDFQDAKSKEGESKPESSEENGKENQMGLQQRSVTSQHRIP